MPRHFENRVFPYSPEQLFDLVADIEKYPEFLPWCQEARIIERTETGVKADLAIGFKSLRETFRSEVVFKRPEKIIVSYGGGALKKLTNEWQFDSVKGGRCSLTFFVDFEMRSTLLGGVMELFFDRAFTKIVTAFEERAKALYGKKYG